MNRNLFVAINKSSNKFLFCLNNNNESIKYDILFKRAFSVKNEIYIKLQMCYNKNTNGKSKI